MIIIIGIGGENFHFQAYHQYKDEFKYRIMYLLREVPKPSIWIMIGTLYVK